jgi:hypothetical protein
MRSLFCSCGIVSRCPPASFSSPATRGNLASYDLFGIRSTSLWRDHYNHTRPHSALNDRAPALFAALHQPGPTRSALSNPGTAKGKPRQGSASPAKAALDPVHLLPHNANNQGEALLRIAQTRDSLLSLWSDFQARQSGRRGS